jgi:glycosyltransferase involved in cell wall biosynthesis
MDLMNRKPLTLSIIIPVYNEENHLQRCLEAIVAQTKPPDEVIVVDNNSTDRSVEIAKRFPFVKVVREKKQGRVFARNCGFDASQCDLIGRIDADTHLPSDWVAAVLDLATELSPHQAVTGPCEFRHLPRIGRWIHRVIYFWSSRLLFGHQTLFGSNMFLFRSQWQNVRGSVCLRNDIHEDMDLAVHIVQSGGSTLFDSRLRASISNRRWFRWLHYPKMWLKTRLVHVSLPPVRRKR